MLRKYPDSDQDDRNDEPQDIDLEESERPDGPQTCPCPACGAYIYDDADRCPYCGQYVILDIDPARRRGLWWMLLGAAGISAVLVLSTC